MSQNPAPAVTAQVRILGNQYLVVIDGHSHVVGKDRRGYAKLGGENDTTSEMRQTLWIPKHFPGRNISADVVFQMQYSPRR